MGLTRKRSQFTLFKYKNSTKSARSSLEVFAAVKINPPPPFPSGFSPSALSAAVGSLSFYVKKGIACWSNSGSRTPLTTSINAGGLTITDSKIFQSPPMTSTRIVFFVLAFMSALIKKKKNWGNVLNRHEMSLLLPQLWFT